MFRKCGDGECDRRNYQSPPPNLTNNMKQNQQDRNEEMSSKYNWMPTPPNTTVEEQNKTLCEHGVAKEYCFNCRYKEKFGMKIEMFNNHHYVRLKEVEKYVSHQHSQLKEAVDKLAVETGSIIEGKHVVFADDVIELLK